MSDIDTEIGDTPTDLYCQAIVSCLLKNDPLREVVSDRIYHHDPESMDPFRVPDSILVWNDPSSFRLNPKPGDFAWPVFRAVIVLILPTRNFPRLPGDMTPDRILWHVEKILERGTVGSDFQPYEVGKLVDPRVDPDDPLITPVQKFLNRKGPVFARGSKRVIRNEDGTESTTGWPCNVTYESTSTRRERQPQ